VNSSITFTAPEYHADGTIRPATYALSGCPSEGWEIHRNNRIHLRLGEGYRPLRVSHCGICATDLARRHLPFPLPQIIGHEVVAFDDNGELVVIEINASHAGRGLARNAWCEFCRNGLDTHCPDRLVLGIHDLPGGFGSWVLAPVRNVQPVPTAVTPASATLVEPFAAALHAVETIAPRAGDCIAVLGPRRLGSLVIAALAAWRARNGQRFEVLAIARRAELRALARRLGADDAVDAIASGSRHRIADVVIETTGHPDGLALAVQLARREVHVKSTCGQPTLGLSHLTELVVDEISVRPYSDSLVNTSGDPPIAAVFDGVPDHVTRSLTARGLRVVGGDTLDAITEATRTAGNRLGGADLAVVSSPAGVDQCIRPRPTEQRGLVRPRGTIYVADVGQPRDPLLSALLDNGVCLSTSRCGDFQSALDVLGDPALRLGERLGEILVTEIAPAERLAHAFVAATSSRNLKVVVTHDDNRLIA